MHWLAAVSEMIYYDHDEDMYHILGYTYEKEQSTWADILNSLCDPTWVGELYTSNAPADPLLRTRQIQICLNSVAATCRSLPARPRSRS